MNIIPYSTNNDKGTDPTNLHYSMDWAYKASTPKEINQSKLYILPHWILRQITRHKLTLNDLRSYSKLRQVLTVDDMAEWFYLNDSFRMDERFSLSTSILETYFDSMTAAEKVELSNSVLSLSGSEEIANSAISKLSQSNLMSNCLYEFVRADNGLFLVLKEGFITEMTNPVKLSEFVKQYLKFFYASLPIHEVSQVNMFGFYLKQLQNK